MHHKDLKITNNFKITGRGTVLITEFEGLPEGKKLNIGDTLRYGHKIWEITGIEGMRRGNPTPAVGLLVKEITQKDLFCKLVTKNDSTVVEDIRWRTRNKWWIRPVQKIQLRLLGLGIKWPRWIFEITKAPKK